MGDAPNNRTTTQHTQKGNKVNNLKAPLAVFATGTLLAIIGGEPGAIVIAAVVALLGYGLNKAGN